MGSSATDANEITLHLCSSGSAVWAFVNTGMFNSEVSFRFKQLAHEVAFKSPLRCESHQGRLPAQWMLFFQYALFLLEDGE